MTTDCAAAKTGNLAQSHIIQETFAQTLQTRRITSRLAVGGGDMALGFTAVADTGAGAAKLRSGALIALFISLPLFLFYPELDTHISGLFFSPASGFSGNDARVETLRNAFKLVYIVACLLAVTGAIWVRVARCPRFLSLSALQHIFLLACLALGPGVVTNLTFKDHWGRARPREIVLFGGTKTFTPAPLPATQCKRNCSFVCGEASSIFMVFFAAALLLPRWYLLLTLSGMTGGFVVGAVRVAQGGHFLSDVVFAGILMALTATALHQLFQSVVVHGIASPEEL